MASSVADIRKANRKEIELPDGTKVEIKKIQISVFVGIGELPYPVTSSAIEDAKDQTAAVTKQLESEMGSDRLGERFNRNKQYLSRAIVAGSISPKFSDRPEDIDRDDVIHVDELGQDNFIFLAEAILDWSGHSGEGLADAEAFRKDGVGESSVSHGSEVPPSTNGDSSS